MGASQVAEGFPHNSLGKESSCNAGDPSSIPGSGRSPGEGIGYPLWYSWASLVAQLVKNLPAVRETWVWSLDWEDSLRRERLPTPVFSPGELHGLYGPWGRKESDTTERLPLTHSGGWVIKSPPANAGDIGSIRRPRRSHMSWSN